MTILGSGIEMRMTRPSAFGEGLTHRRRVGQGGSVAAPTVVDQTRMTLVNNWPGHPCYSRSRDVSPLVHRGKIATPADCRRVRTTGPADTGEAGTLVDDPDTRDITATVVDLAVRAMCESASAKAGTSVRALVEHGLCVSADKATAEWACLTVLRQLLLEALFKDSEVDEDSPQLARKPLQISREYDAIFQSLQSARITASARPGETGISHRRHCLRNAADHRGLASSPDRWGLAPLTVFVASLLSG